MLGDQVAFFLVLRALLAPDALFDLVGVVKGFFARGGSDFKCSLGLGLGDAAGLLLLLLL